MSEHTPGRLTDEEWHDAAVGAWDRELLRADRAALLAINADLLAALEMLRGRYVEDWAEGHIEIVDAAIAKGEGVSEHEALRVNRELQRLVVLLGLSGSPPEPGTSMVEALSAVADLLASANEKLIAWDLAALFEEGRIT